MLMIIASFCVGALLAYCYKQRKLKRHHVTARPSDHKISAQVIAKRDCIVRLPVGTTMRLHNGVVKLATSSTP